MHAIKCVGDRRNAWQVNQPLFGGAIAATEPSTSTVIVCGGDQGRGSSVAGSAIPDVLDYLFGEPVQLPVLRHVVAPCCVRSAALIVVACACSDWRLRCREQDG